MYQYKIVYQCSNGYEGEEIVYAANRIVAFDMFNNLGYEDVVSADCFRVIDDE